MFAIILFVISVLISGIYYLSKWKFDYWKKQNVPYIEPTPIFGNYSESLLLRKHVTYVIDGLCKKMPNEPYFGTFYGTEPALVVKDPELLKLIMTKDFYYFSGREISKYIHKEDIARNLFSNSGDEWKVVRQNLTPVFTSAKMKNMFHLIAKCAYELENLLDAEYKMSDIIEARLLVSRFTMACITSCAFGVDSDTMGEGYSKNPFMKVGDSVFRGSRLRLILINTRLIWPRIYYGLGLHFATKGINSFFENFLISVFEARQYKPSPRNDFIDFILNFKQNKYMVGDSITNLKTGEDKKVELPVTDALLASQSMVFFLAGFETSAATSSYTLYELAKHPEVQKKVQEEIDAYLNKYGNKITYEVVSELPYTYACVEETMRLFPVVTRITREVIEDYTLPSGVRLNKGMRIHIPVYHLHRDSKFFSDPEVFRPERFLGDERRKIIPYSYIPFGEGARICIGKRFAKMQVLAGLVTLLKKFNVEMDENTPRDLEFNPNLLIPVPKQPLKFKVTLREGWESRLLVKT